MPSFVSCFFYFYFYFNKSFVTNKNKNKRAQNPAYLITQRMRTWIRPPFRSNLDFDGGTYLKIITIGQSPK